MDLSEANPEAPQPAPLAAATLPSHKKQVKQRKPPQGGWVSWWPVAVGLVLGLLGTQVSSLVSAYNPWAMRIVFPLALIAGLRETGADRGLARDWR